MSAAKPVVATNVWGASEAIIDGETGYLMYSNDDKAMADRVIELLRSPLRAIEMGEMGRRIVTEKFSLRA